MRRGWRTCFEGSLRCTTPTMLSRNRLAILGTTVGCALTGAGRARRTKLARGAFCTQATHGRSVPPPCSRVQRSVPVHADDRVWPTRPPVLVPAAQAVQAVLPWPGTAVKVLTSHSVMLNHHSRGGK
jgi:hypothetical protein